MHNFLSALTSESIVLHLGRELYIYIEGTQKKVMKGFAPGARLLPIEFALILELTFTALKIK